MTEAARGRLRQALAVLGLAIAAYLTRVHYFRHAALACPLHGGIVDCERVLTSPQSQLLGVPLAIWGVVWFAVALALALPASGGGAPSLRLARRAWAAVGGLAVVYFVYLELMVIGRLCIWCTAVHVIVLGWLALELADPRAADSAG